MCVRGGDVRRSSGCWHPLLLSHAALLLTANNLLSLQALLFIFYVIEKQLALSSSFAPSTVLPGPGRSRRHLGGRRPGTQSLLAGLGSFPAAFRWTPNTGNQACGALWCAVCLRLAWLLGVRVAAAAGAPIVNFVLCRGSRGTRQHHCQARRSELCGGMWRQAAPPRMLAALCVLAVFHLLAPSKEPPSQLPWSRRSLVARVATGGAGATLATASEEQRSGSSLSQTSTHDRVLSFAVCGGHATQRIALHSGRPCSCALYGSLLQPPLPANHHSAPLSVRTIHCGRRGAGCRAESHPGAGLLRDGDSGDDRTMGFVCAEFLHMAVDLGVSENRTQSALWPTTFLPASQTVPTALPMHPSTCSEVFDADAFAERMQAQGLRIASAVLPISEAVEVPVGELYDVVAALKSPPYTDRQHIRSEACCGG